jgi:hypothetical protein
MLAALLFTALLARPAAAQSLTPPWVDLANALPGTYGAPILSVNGSLAPGSALTLSLTNAIEYQHAYLVLGFGTIYAPYKGGILVPKFDLLFQFSTGPVGAVTIVAHWPNNVLPGIPVVMQYWINDDAAPLGRAGSNAIAAVTP